MSLRNRIDRRAVLQRLAATGVGGAVFQRALAALAEEQPGVSAEMVRQAEWIAGLELSEEDRQQVAAALQGARRKIDAMRSCPIGYDVPPALYFAAEPLAVDSPPVGDRNWRKPPAPDAATAAGGAELPTSSEALAFLPITALAALLRQKQVSSVELTQLYLERLRKYDPLLQCVVTLTEELALEQARRADAELASGADRGILHGIPWGAKDLIAYPGYPTTWGAPQFQQQVLAERATVAQRLDEAGAVLVAKLSLGALAMGDEWLGKRTRNPWNPAQGSSGSSAGSSAAAAAGLVGFALGSETLGSIISPGRRCGSSSLRPTFGRVSRHGCMTLAWSMDKLGPICRSIDDCGWVLDVIHGADGRDPTARDRAFAWPPTRPLGELTVGYFEQSETPAAARAELALLRELGVRLTPIELPTDLPASAIALLLGIEASAAFDDLVQRNDLEQLYHWPSVFRQARFIPATEYLRANRLRTLAMRAMAELFERVDLYVGGDDLTITNLTGHPSVVLPSGVVDPGAAASPPTITFTGRLFGESELLAVASAYQRATGFQLRHPVLPG